MINYKFETTIRFFVDDKEFVKGEDVIINTGTRIITGVLAGFCDEFNLLYIREHDEGLRIGAVRMIPLDSIVSIDKS